MTQSKLIRQKQEKQISLKLKTQVMLLYQIIVLVLLTLRTTNFYLKVKTLIFKIMVIFKHQLGISYVTLSHVLIALQFPR